MLGKVGTSSSKYDISRRGSIEGMARIVWRDRLGMGEMSRCNTYRKSSRVSRMEVDGLGDGSPGL